LYTAISQIATANPDHTSMQYHGKAITRAQLILHAKQAAGRILLQADDLPGAKVCLMVSNPASLLACLLGLDLLQVTAVLVDRQQPLHIIKNILLENPTALLVTDLDMNDPAIAGFEGRILELGGWEDAFAHKINITSPEAANDEAFHIYCGLKENTADNKVVISRQRFAQYAEACKTHFMDTAGTLGLLLPVSSLDLVRIAVPALSAGSSIEFIDLNNIAERAAITSLFVSAGDDAVFEQSQFTGVKQLICFHDARRLEKAWGMEKIRAQFPDCHEIIRLYGRPEASFASAFSRVQLNKPIDERNLAGTPLYKGSLLVLDKRLLPVAVDIAGDVYLDAPTPIRTGEKGRFLSDKILELVKQAPDEIYIDGVPLGRQEIEQVLRTNEKINDASLSDASLVPGHTSIPVMVETSAYWTPSCCKKILESHFGSAIARNLQMVTVPDFPLNALGKTDQKQLAAFSYIDEGAIRKVSNTLQSLPGVQQHAVLPVMSRPQADVLYLDLKAFTGQQNARHAQQNESRKLLSIAPAFFQAEKLITYDDDPSTLGEGFIKTARSFSNKGITFVAAGGTTYLSYAALMQKSLAVLARLQDAGLKPGSRVIIQVRESHRFFPVFWACMLGGISPLTIAVPPAYKKGYAVADKLFHAWTVMEKPMVLADSTAARDLPAADDYHEMEGLQVINVQDVEEKREGIIHKGTADDIAFFLLTSGSSGNPKCTRIAQRGALAHLKGVRQMEGYNHGNVIVNILPIDHITPLLLMHVRSVVFGSDQVQVHTEHFINQPLVWLDVLEQYKGTHTFSPNFAYKLVLDSLRNSPGKKWELSHVERFTNGGEMISFKVAEDFFQALASSGLREDCFHPGYGMTEMAGGITFTKGFSFKKHVHYLKRSSLQGELVQTNREDPNRVAYIEVGECLPGVSMRITGQENVLLPEGQPGRIEFKGDVVTPGYLNNTNATSEVFTPDGWFFTGDLGFLYNGKLVITGRENDTIIIRGVNHYCFELESTINGINGIRETFVAATAVENASGEEEVALFFTPKDETDVNGIIRQIKIRITESFGIEPAYIIPLQADAFPKTESGKTNRKLLKHKLVRGEFDALRNDAKEKKFTLHTYYRYHWKKNARVPILGNRDGFNKTLLWVVSDGFNGIIPTYYFGGLVIRVDKGTTRSRDNSVKYTIRDGVAEDYQWVLNCLQAEGLFVTDIMYTCGLPGTGNMETEAYGWIERAGKWLSGIGCWETAFSKILSGHVNLWIVWETHSNALPSPPAVVSNTAAPGLLRIRQVFVQEAYTGTGINELLKEVWNKRESEAVCLLHEKRYELEMQKAPLTREQPAFPALKKDSVWILLGEQAELSDIAAHLNEAYGCRCIIVCKSIPASAPSTPDWLRYLAQTADTAAALLEATADWSEPEGIFVLEDLSRSGITVMQSASLLGVSLATNALIKRLVDRCHINTCISILRPFKSSTSNAVSLPLLMRRQALPDEQQIASCFLVLQPGPEERTAIQVALQGGFKGLVHKVPDNSMHWGQLPEPFTGKQNLVVFYTSEQPQVDLRPFQAIIEEFPVLRDRLYFKKVDQLQLDQDGNVNYSLLLADDYTHGKLLPEEQANDLELALAAIWKDVLKSPGVHVRDNFFELGGNSLKATQVIFRIQQQFGAKLELANVFAHPTIRSLAAFIAASGDASYEPIPVIAQAAHYDLSHAQKCLWIIAQTEREHIAYNMPVAIVIKKEIDREAFTLAFDALVQRHDSLRTSFITVAGDPRQRISSKGPGLSWIDLSADPARRELAIGMAEAEVLQPFDLENGPVLRAGMVYLGASEYVLLFTMHHIVSDGMSMQVLLHDFFALYTAFCERKPDPLAPLRIQYKEYVSWHKQQLQSVQMQEHRAYWLKKLEHPIPVLELPVKGSRDGKLKYKGTRSVYRINESTSARLAAFNVRHGLTMFMSLNAFLKLMLNHLSKQEDIIIGSPVAGRSHPDLQDQAGLYLNNIVLRDQVRDNDLFVDFLQQVRQTTVDAYLHQDYPYDLLVEELGLKQAGSRNPLYDVMLVMDVEDQEGHYLNRIPGFEKTEILDIEYPVSKLDLTLFCKIEKDIRLEFEYRTDLFDNSMIDNLAANMMFVIGHLLEHPGLTVYELKAALKSTDEIKEHESFVDSILQQVEEEF
jgi:acyl-CoA synthetase (AMP-forming)/AMP-acid ligase II/acyl carrier protein